jgi:hypothetical protein
MYGACDGKGGRTAADLTYLLTYLLTALISPRDGRAAYGRWAEVTYQTRKESRVDILVAGTRSALRTLSDFLFRNLCILFI